MRLDYSAILVRSVTQSEECQWLTLMREHDYLGFNGVLGERINYIAEIDGEWIALLSWASAAFKIRPRDQWLGWSLKQKNFRLKFIANNWRFLILPQWHRPNLASFILAQNLRRLSQDWENKYDHPILMAETFVDSQQFRGTCYKADNWVSVGETSGFQKERRSYRFHGNKKLIFMKPLRARAQQILGCQWTHPIFLPPTTRGQMKMKLDKINVFSAGGLFEFAQTLRDGRSQHGKRYQTPGMITLCILAALAGIKGYKGIALWTASLDTRTLELLKLWRKPSESTIRRFLLSMPADEFDKWVTQWLFKSKSLCGTVLALDGKVLRGSHDGEKKATQLLSIVDHKDGMVITQREVSNKTNEIPIAQKLLSEMEIKGCVITGDALHTQDKTATIIARDREADYVFTVKDNRKKLKKEIKARLSSCAFSPSGHI